MKKSLGYLLIGIAMVMFCIVYISYALMHPEGSFAIPLEVTYLFYIIYIVIMLTMFIVSSLYRKKKE